MKSILSAALVMAALFTTIAPAAERAREVRFVLAGSNADAVARAVGLPKQYYVHDAAGTKKLGTILLRFGGLDFRAAHLAASEGPLVLTTDPNPGSVRNPQQVIGKFEVPPDAPSLILLLIPRGADLIGCQALAFDDGGKAFPAGSIRAVNLSPGPMRFVIDGKMSNIAAGATETIMPVAPLNPGGLVAVRAYRQEKQSWQQIYAASWPIGPKRRAIQVVHPVPGKPNFEIVGISDRIGN